MMITRRHLLAGLAGLGCEITSGKGQALERGNLDEIASRLVGIYQTSDVDALHRMLAPDLQTSFSAPVLTRWLAEARESFGMLQRISMPTYGSRTHGVFAAYFNARPIDMYLEVDQQGRIVFWALKNASATLALRRK
jgi:hypothetical protein